MTRRGAALLVLVVGCSFDTGGSSSFGGGDPSDGGIDGPLVGCSSDVHCMSPPNPCKVAGTCNLVTGVCEFPDKDCSAMNGECTVGRCDQPSGQCVAAPANEGMDCGGGTSCTDYSQCGGFDDVCDQTGTRSRTCTAMQCVAGACMSGAPFQESQACNRNTNGITCAPEVISGCSDCGGFDSTCDETGTQVCACTTYTCSSGTCNGSVATCSRSCTRVTEGDTCGLTPVGCTMGKMKRLCCTLGTCAMPCGMCEDP